MKTVKTNFETLSHGLQKDRHKSKKYDWLHEIAAVNEMARAKHLSYGHFVSEGYMSFVKVPRPPRGYKTAREWARIRSQQKLKIESVQASKQRQKWAAAFNEQDVFCYQDTDSVK